MMVLPSSAGFLSRPFLVEEPAPLRGDQSLHGFLITLPPPRFLIISPPCLCVLPLLVWLFEAPLCSPAKSAPWTGIFSDCLSCCFFQFLSLYPYLFFQDRSPPRPEDFVAVPVANFFPFFSGIPHDFPTPCPRPPLTGFSTHSVTFASAQGSQAVFFLSTKLVLMGFQRFWGSDDFFPTFALSDLACLTVTLISLFRSFFFVLLVSNLNRYEVNTPNPVSFRFWLGVTYC